MQKNNIRFRLMEKNDLDEVCRIEKETFSMPWSYQSFLISMKKKENIYAVAQVGEIIVGYCGVWCVAGEGQINNIAVEKGHQNQGIGYGILRFILEEGKKHKLESFTLEVRKSNKSAIHLYEKIGFQIAGIRNNFYKSPTEDAILMTVITSMNDSHKTI